MAFRDLAAKGGRIMEPATMEQVGKIINLLSDKKVSRDRLQRILENGALSDILEASEPFDREAHRRLLGLEPLSPRLLALISATTIPARTWRFLPKDAFSVNIREDAHVKISHVEPRFIEWFGEKVIDWAPEVSLRWYAFMRPATFASAVKEIGSEAVVKANPGDLYSLLERQPNGPRGRVELSLADGHASLFEMEDVRGVDRLVLAHWPGAGWCIDALPIADLTKWSPRSLIFFRNAR